MTPSTSNLIHMPFGAEGRLPMFPTVGSVRLAVRSLYQRCRDRVVLINAVDSHSHPLLDAGDGFHRWVRIVHGAFAPFTRGVLETPYEGRIENAGHLRTVVSYILEQQPRHGLRVDPALWPGSCFQDLVGARCVPGFRPVIFDWIPRLCVEDLHDCVGIPRTRIQPATDDQLWQAGLFRIVRACEEATCVDPTVEGRTHAMTRFHTTVVHLGREVGATTPQLAAALSLSHRAVRKCDEREPEPDLLRATRVRISLEDFVAEVRRGEGLDTYLARVAERRRRPAG